MPSQLATILAEGATESNLTAVTATVVGVAVILIVVTGFAGMAYKKRCLLIMYGVFVAIAMFLFIAVAILGFRAATAETTTHKNNFLQRHGNYLGLAAVVLTIVSILILRIGYHLHRNPNAYREAHYGRAKISAAEVADRTCWTSAYLNKCNRNWWTT
ncbi:hypothetical protein Ae201684P_018636 [Aphanomyces euteiches]|uniref:Uncharacterized protein n=1 Tax=Aphanomyces euteiches TaxID=100861 RepID=A0A6G0XVI7_9STRA|nr:hypothetical protein Ae201684_001140 [Aphanomyces euteiches]KAH9099623.1 hypothetical protein Ae201684P_018636 [Aphanomyces euteiches]KAH9152267.1 hypothetical protein AeRB84_005278 [Aphanomyces euteiches]